MSHDHHGPAKEPIGWMDKPEVVKRFFRVFYVLCALTIVGELFVDRELHHPWEWVFSFYGLWGFASFWFLVLVAKQMRKLLIRSEDYYDVG